MPSTFGSSRSGPHDSPHPGLQRQIVPAKGFTVSRYEFTPHASFPRHSHAQEQVTVVLEGEVRFADGNGEHLLRPGDWVRTGAWEEHGITAGDGAAVILAVVSPARVGDHEIHAA